MTRKRITALVLAALVLLIGLALFWVSRPQHLARLILDRAGNALGLEITATGTAEYRLRGTPMLVVRKVTATEPGATTPLLRADRILLSLPWSTIKAGGSDLTVQRVELDAPRIDLSALQHWLATRPPSDAPRLPTLTDGLQVSDGRVDGGGWQIEDLQVDLAALHPATALRATVRGRHVAAPLSAPFDLVVGVAGPQAVVEGRVSNGSAKGIVTLDSGDWSLPATVTLSGPLRYLDGALTFTPLRFGAAARYVSGDTAQPFNLGLQGPLRYADGALTLSPVGVALRGKDADSPIPVLHAGGRLALDTRLHIALDGRIAAWPDAWPALPPPIGQSASPLPFALRYDGAHDASDAATLWLARDDTRFEGRFHLPVMLDWINADATGTATPLPPLDGRLTTPRLEVSGATLEGVEVLLHEDDSHEEDEDEAVAP